MLPFINIFGHNVDSAYFFWGVGIIVAQIYYQAMGKHYGFRWYMSLLYGFLFTVFEMIGAKILYIAENFTYVLENGIGFGGFSLFGIMLSLPLLTLPLSRCARVPYGNLMDFASSGILLGLALYRVGCTCVGCCRGLPFFFGIAYINAEVLFPVQPTEAVLDILLAITLTVLFLKKKLKRGEQYLLFMSGYGLIRFVLEFTRERSRLIGIFSLAHIWAGLALAVGITLFLRSRGNKKCSAEL